MKLITSRFLIKAEPAGLAGTTEQFYDTVFGATRRQKASHQFRLAADPVTALSWVAMEGDALVGAIRYWPIEIGTARHLALLLGPLAIASTHLRQGIGSALIDKTLALASQAGHDLVLLVGDPAYYQRFGFILATPFGLVMPGESRPDRLQVLALKHQMLDRVTGELRSYRDYHAAIMPVAANEPTRPIAGAGLA